MNDNSQSGKQYFPLIEDLLAELSQSLDEHVVAKVVSNVSGLKVSEEGKVLSIEGNPQDIVQELVNKFLGLSNEIVIKTMQPILKQCPWIKISNTDANASN